MAALIKFLQFTLGGLLKWFFTTAIIKFFVFGVIFLSVTEVVPLLIEVFLDGYEISGQLDALAFWLKPFALDKGIPMILSAYMTRFMIRRIPVVG